MRVPLLQLEGMLRDEGGVPGESDVVGSICSLSVKFWTPGHDYCWMLNACAEAQLVEVSLELLKEWVHFYILEASFLNCV